MSGLNGAPRRARAGGSAEHVDRDRETRTRLLEVARELFATRGFRRVTVREICHAAGANVAAVNYHFGDKLGLYRDVLDAAIAIMQETSELARAAGDGGNAEQRLRAFIHVFVQRVGQGRDSWIRRLMTHEVAESTPALDQVVEQAVLPRITYMRELVGEMLGLPSGDERVLRCVLSVQSQFQTAMGNAVSRQLVPGVHDASSSIDLLARHVADFSIGGILAIRAGLAASPVEPTRPWQKGARGTRTARR